MLLINVPGAAHGVVVHGDGVGHPTIVRSTTDLPTAPATRAAATDVAPGDVETSRTPTPGRPTGRPADRRSARPTQ